MKLFFSAILLSITSACVPAFAQSIEPTVYGQRYCLLRSFGVEVEPARKAAVEYSWRPERSVSNLSQDVKNATEYVIKNCN